MSRKPVLAIAASLTVFLLACTGSNVTPTTQPAATQSPEPAATPTATATPLPTSTPDPTATPTPSPTPSPTATSTPSPTPTPRPQFFYSPAECAFESDPDILSYLLPEVECGYLTVPENRSVPGSRHIRLHVAVFKSTADNPAPDPVVYLAGGPGQGAAGSLAADPSSLGGYIDFLASRDLIILDQRGTGYSEPDLGCQELDEMDEEAIGDLSGALPEETVAALLACKTRLEAEGADLSAYNSAENAADVAALRLALGYGEWNLLGVSYGTRLAQTIVRDHPEGIRSVIFDSVYPIEEDLYESSLRNTDRVLDALGAECSAGGGPCVGLPGSFKQTLLDVALRLDGQPVDITVTDPDTGEPVTVPLTGWGLINTVFSGLYSNQIIPHLPGMVFSARDGDYDMVAWLISALQADTSVSTGMYLSVQCAEEVPFTDLAVMNDLAAGFPELLQLYSGGEAMGADLKQMCEIWRIGLGTPSPLENDPVTGIGIPVLVLAGSLDPVTPPAWGLALSENFPDSTFLELRGIGHAVTFNSECARQIAEQFLANLNPLPDSESLCVADLPGVQFVEPLREIRMVEFEDAQVRDLAGVAPEGWSYNEGSSVYLHSDLGLFALLQDAVMASREAFLPYYFEILGLDEAPEPLWTQDSPHATWTIFEFELQGLTVNLAVGELSDGRLGVVLTTSLPGTHSLVYNHLFLPAVLALRPV